MHIVDWLVVLFVVGVLTIAAVRTKKYTRSVADFLAANRCAGRYLLTVSEGMAGLGAITLIAGFEIYYKTGFTAAWWAFLLVVVRTAVMLSGWIVYRYRQTRVLTMAQFLEKRYSKNFRIFAGILAWLAGIINFGVFPAVGARFMIFFCGFPNTMPVYATVLIVLISVALLFTYLGGQIAVIVTDFLQGTFTNLMFIVITVVLLCLVDWSSMIDTVMQAPSEQSMINPFQTQNAKDFNIWFFLIQAWGFIYAMGVWQGNQGYNSSALSAHEARMGKILSTWRIMAVDLFVMFVPICAYVFYNSSIFSNAVEDGNGILAGISNPQIVKQMRTVVAMKVLLPVGVSGGFVALMLAAFISTHDTYLHSWGSIFIQDVVMPFRKKPLETKEHMKLLRLSILGVAVFIFLFSLSFRQTEYISMFFMITGAIFVGGAGVVVIGGLYWKKGTTLAAWVAMITGSVLSVGVIAVKQIHAVKPFDGVLGWVSEQNGAVLSFYAMIAAIIAYAVISLLDHKNDYNLDKLLYRGKYKDEKSDGEVVAGENKTGLLGRLAGMSDEFTARDKLVYIATMVWTSLIIIVFIAVTVLKFVFGVEMDIAQWAYFWKIYFGVVFSLSILTAVWFTIGGALDLKKMFRLLKTVKRDDSDDGGMHEEICNNEVQEVSS